MELNQGHPWKDKILGGGLKMIAKYIIPGLGITFTIIYFVYGMYLETLDKNSY